MSCNGWSNRETWLINVWFNPESKSDLAYAKEVIETDYDALPDYMKDFVDLNVVDWEELADALDEEESEE